MTSTKANTAKNPDRLGRLRNEHQLATIAILYYREGLTQNEIAKRFGVSRATVVNHLKMARELGIVDIRIAGSSFATSTLSKAIKTRFDLEDVYIASVHDTESGAGPPSETDIMRQTARVAAMALCEIVTSGDILGVAWGKTIQMVAEELPALDKPGLTVFQMIGSMKSPLLVAAETCAINIAKRFAADCYTLPAPAILSSAGLAEALRAEPFIKTQLEKLGGVNKSLFSVGSCMPRTHLVASGIASLEDLQWYVEHGAVGVICGRFIDRNGDHVIGPLDQRMIGIDPGQLQKVATGIMVFSGLHKLEAALAAIRGGYTTHLIVDERSGTELLKLADNL
jgi:DNA-binding transcriptional regulator LsrR (DeoR family)